MNPPYDFPQCEDSPHTAVKMHHAHSENGVNPIDPWVWLHRISSFNHIQDKYSFSYWVHVNVLIVGCGHRCNLWPQLEFMTTDHSDADLVSGLNLSLLSLESLYCLVTEFLPGSKGSQWPLLATAEHVGWSWKNCLLVQKVNPQGFCFLVFSKLTLYL